MKIFDTLTEEEKHRLSKGMVKKHATKRSIVYSASEGYIYFLEKGMVKTIIDRPGYREALSGIVGAGQFWNIQGLFGDMLKSEHAEVIDNQIEYYQISAKVIKAIMADNGAFCNAMHLVMVDCMKRLEQRVTLVYSHRNVKSRLLTFFKQFAREHGRKVGDEIAVTHKLTHNDIADLVFSTRQSVTGAMNKLRRENLINYERGQLLIRLTN